MVPEAGQLPAARGPTPSGLVADFVGLREGLAELVRQLEELSLTDAGSSLLADRLGERMAELVNSSCIVLLVDADGRTFTPAASYLQVPEVTALLRQLFTALPQRVERDESASAVEQRQPVAFAGAQLRQAIDPHYWPFLDAAGVNSLLAVPMLTGDDLVGVLVFPRRQPEVALSPAEVDVLVAAADRLAFTLRQVQLREQARGAAGGLQGAKSGLQLVLDRHPALISCYNADWRCEFVNAEQRRHLADAAESVLGKHVRDVLGDELYQAIAPRIGRVLAGEAQVLTLPSPTEGDGEQVLLVRIVPIGEGPRAAGFTVMVTTMPDGQSVPRDWSGQEDIAALRASFDHAPIGMAIVALDGRFMRVNQEMCEITGYGSADLTELKFDDISHPEDQDAEALQTERLLTGEIDSYEMEKRYYDPNGHTIWVDMSRSLVRTSDGDPTYFVVYLEDISNRKREEERLRHLAERDPLTGLLNRRRFEEELRRYEQMAMRYGDITGVLMIDIDDLKTVNDSQGHPSGDELIKNVAQTMSNRLRMTDILARIGGDEFAALLPHTSAMHVATVGAELCELIETRCGTSVSVGAAIIDESSPSGGLDRADRVMYLVKREGGGGIRVDEGTGDSAPAQ